MVNSWEGEVKRSVVAKESSAPNNRLQPDRGPRAVLSGCETSRLGCGG
jgi:hypothetical protein